MKKYNPDNKCPKCGSDEVSIIYHEDAAVLYPCFPNVHGEHFCRECQNCQYQWQEAVMDSEISSADKGSE